MENDIPLPINNIARRMVCPGSARLEALQPKREMSESQKECQSAYELAEYVCDDPKTKFMGLGPKYSEEMREGARMLKHHLNTLPMVNAPIFYKNYIFSLDIQCAGALIVTYYSFGHSPVEVFENWELLLKTKLFIKEHIPEVYISEIFFYVIQPRCYSNEKNINSWEITIEQAKKYWRKIEEADEKALEPDAPCLPSPQCKLCSARAECTALKKSSLSIVEMSQENRVMNLPPQELGQELKILQHGKTLLDARISGLEEQAFAIIKAGERVPGFTIGRTRGHKFWADSDSKIIEMGELMGLDLSKPKTAITPNQAEKKGIPKDWIEAKSKVTLGNERLEVESEVQIKKLFNN